MNSWTIVNRGLSFAFVLLLPLGSAGADVSGEASSAPEDESTAAVMSMLAPETEAVDLSPSPLSFTPALGLALSQPKELNAWFASHTLNGQSISGQISWAAALSVTTRIELMRGLSFGLRVEYGDIQNSRKVTFNDVSASMTSELSWLLPSITADYKVPVSARFWLGATTSVGLPFFYHLNLQSSATGSIDDNESYAASPVAASLGLFGILDLSKHALLRVEAGYRFFGASSMESSSGTVLNDSTGTAIPVDASAPYLEAGLTFLL